MRSNKGITLVALVITIIVLLILAGVSISLVVGDNGVLTQAKNSASKSAEAQAKEDVETAISSLQSQFINTWNNNTTSQFSTYLTAERFTAAYKGKYTATFNDTSKKVTVQINGTSLEGQVAFGDNGLGASISWPASTNN